MENLKIYIGQNNAPTQNEAFDCLLFLGYTWRGTRDYITQRNFDAMYADDEGIKVDSSISLSMFNQINTEYRAVTIEELRAMLVIQRNSKEDANHTDQDGWLWWVDGDVSLVWKVGNPDQEDRWDKESLDHVDLKPIQKPQAQQPTSEPAPLEEEYLNIKTGELLLWDKGQPRSTDWIKVPEGADDLVMFNDEGGFFWKYGKRENGTLCCYYIGVGAGYRTLIPEWEEISKTAHAYVGDFGGWTSPPKIVWQRNLQPEKQSLNDIAKTAEEHRQSLHTEEVADPQLDFELPDTVYQYSASINTPRGTVHYDGVITFPGRITGIEDYHKVRAEIAKDGNTTPDQVNVHSLNIVG